MSNGNGNVDRQTDRQMDVGHINLIGGLVTCNPPKNRKSFTQIIYGTDARLSTNKLYSPQYIPSTDQILSPETPSIIVL